MKSFIILLFTFLVSNSLSANVSVVELDELYSKPSPFESIPKSEWVAQSENAFVINAKSPQSPVRARSHFVKKIELFRNTMI
jgi:hypothetical protein